MLLLRYHPSSLTSTGMGVLFLEKCAASKVSLSTSLHGWVKEERTHEHHSSYPRGFTQGCSRQPGSPRQEASTHFWSILPIAPGRMKPVQPKMSLGSSFSREAQEHLLYCNAQVYTGAERIQGEGTSPLVLPALEMRLLRRLTPRCQTVKALN